MLYVFILSAAFHQGGFSRLTYTSATIAVRFYWIQAIFIRNLKIYLWKFIQESQNVMLRSPSPRIRVSHVASWHNTILPAALYLRTILLLSLAATFAGSRSHVHRLSGWAERGRDGVAWSSERMLIGAEGRAHPGINRQPAAITALPQAAAPPIPRHRLYLIVYSLKKKKKKKKAKRPSFIPTLLTTFVPQIFMRSAQTHA